MSVMTGFIESNLRQQVLGNTNPIKLGRCFDFLNWYYSFQHGGDRKSSSNNYNLKESEIPFTQKGFAESYGITQQTMNNYMRMANMIPELEDLVETGILAPTKLRALISNNFGRRKNDPAKDRKALETYVSLRGYKNGEIGNGREKDSQNGNAKLTLEEIAKQLGTSKTNLTRALRIERNLTDSMKELLDDGVITKTLASDCLVCKGF